MQRHDRDVVRLLVPAIDVRGERDLFEEVGDGALGVQGVELVGRGNEFGDVGQAVCVLLIFREPQHRFVARLFQDERGQFVGRQVEPRAEFGDDAVEVAESGGRLAADVR